MAIPLYLTTIEQDIFDTFRYLPHAVAVGVGFVTVAAAWKNQQIQKKRKRLEQYRALYAETAQAHGLPDETDSEELWLELGSN